MTTPTPTGPSRRLADAARGARDSVLGSRSQTGDLTPAQIGRQKLSWLLDSRAVGATADRVQRTWGWTRDTVPEVARLLASGSVNFALGALATVSSREGFRMGRERAERGLWHVVRGLAWVAMEGSQIVTRSAAWIRIKTASRMNNIPGTRTPASPVKAVGTAGVPAPLPVASAPAQPIQPPTP